MAIAVYSGHVNRALQFYSQVPNMYFVLGNPASGKWNDENVPDNPDPNDNITNRIGYKKVGSAFLIVQDDEGTLVFNNKHWRIVQPENAYEEKARWVYLSAFVEYSELPVDVSYRQIGLTTELVIKDGILSTGALVPNQVENPGILQTLDNRPPIYRDATQKEHLVQVIEF